MELGSWVQHWRRRSGSGGNNGVRESLVSTVQSKPARPPHPVLETLSSCLSCAAPLCVVMEKAFFPADPSVPGCQLSACFLRVGMGEDPDPVPPRSITSLDEVGPFSRNSTMLQASNSEVSCKQVRFILSFHQWLMKQKTSRAGTHTNLVLIWNKTQDVLDRLIAVPRAFSPSSF